MKLMVCGYARHGKDTLAEVLNEHFGLRHESSSHVAMRHFVRNKLEDEYGLEYEDESDCYADRENHRKKWFDIIAEFNREDPSRLSRLIFNSNDIYVGIRKIEEFKAVRKAGLFDLSVWVDASKRLPPESQESNTITADDCDFTITNNRDYVAFVLKSLRVFRGMLN